MPRNPASPKDITANLAHFKNVPENVLPHNPKGPYSPEKKDVPAVLVEFERKLAFDGLSFTLWGAVACIIGFQFVLMVGLSVL